MMAPSPRFVLINTWLFILTTHTAGRPMWRVLCSLL
uniref:Uncharacterized protein n=1 Tax=Anguilla anguilla TaxID=7936 RepID=A0A0E9UL00_ANGAN